MRNQDYILRFTERVRRCRTRLLARYPFFGMLMMNLRFALDDTIGTAATDGTVIVFDPFFKLEDEELDFVVMHELMHVALDHLARGRKYNQMIFNIACDIVVNSNIMQIMGAQDFIVAGEPAMHKAPDGSEGYLYSAEEVYNMLIKESDLAHYHRFDLHDLWKELTPDRRQVLSQIVGSTAAALSKMHGNIPTGLVRSINERTSAKLNWRQILSEFLQEDIYDYSFSQPDRRFGGELIMPDLTITDNSVRNVLFMIDTSGSMLDSDITAAFSEICGAIEQFGGRLSGLLGFFDSEVTPPVPFESVKDVLEIKPIGGGGTSVDIIFDYVKEHMQDNPPESIVILTDGWVLFPEKECANGIPVLWIITSQCISAPSWGNTVWLDPEDEEDIFDFDFSDEDDDEALPFNFVNGNFKTHTLRDKKKQA